MKIDQTQRGFIFKIKLNYFNITHMCSAHRQGFAISKLNETSVEGLSTGAAECYVLSKFAKIKLKYAQKNIFNQFY